MGGVRVAPQGHRHRHGRGARAAGRRPDQGPRHDRPSEDQRRRTGRHDPVSLDADGHRSPGEACREARGGLLFYDRHGRNLRPADFQAAWHAARAAARRGDLKFHHLRHTGAVLAAPSGATLADLMGRLGHRSPAMAMIYQHTAADRDRLISDRLSQIALGSQSPLVLNASRSVATPRRVRSTHLGQPSLLVA
ncbi:MAG: tyrosine-type recombinase/integrase [Actinobacteria bacterium]|nr:tyrosine-type recombinase/integrase [Actinomycetota bacterium]